MAVAGILGVIIIFGQMRGLFKDKDRLSFVEAIETNLECPKDHPGARKFIDKFVHANPEYKNIKIDLEEVEKVVFVGQWMGSSSAETGRSVSSVVAGDLKLKSTNGAVTKPLCSFEDLKNWSRDPVVSKWVGFVLLTVGAILAFVLLLI